MTRRAVLLIAVMATASLLAGGTALAVDKVCSSSCGGTSGNDLLIGSNSSNILSSSDGNDQIIGNGGDDILNGGAGSDTYTFADDFGANDTIEDTAGSTTDRDTVDFSKVPSAYIFVIPEWTSSGWNKAHNSDGFADKVTFYGSTTIEKIVGSPGGDQIKGGKQINTYDLKEGGNDSVTDHGGAPASGSDPALPASNDTYTGYKSGAVVITDWGGSGDILDLKPRKVTDASFLKSGNDLLLQVGPTSSDSIKIVSYFVAKHRIEKIVFAERTITSISLS